MNPNEKRARKMVAAYVCAGRQDLTVQIAQALEKARQEGRRDALRVVQEHKQSLERQRPLHRGPAIGRMCVVAERIESDIRSRFML